MEGQVPIFVSPPEQGGPVINTCPQALSASLSWCQAPIWGLRPDFYYCQTAVGFLMWGDLSDERTSLSFTIAAAYRQRSNSRLRVPWDSRPYFTVSDSRLPFSSPPTSQSQSHIATDSQSVSLDVEPRLGLMTRFLLLSDRCGFVYVGRSLCRVDESVFCICCWPSPA
jgi:hypothetical protein